MSDSRSTRCCSSAPPAALKTRPSHVPVMVRRYIRKGSLSKGKFGRYIGFLTCRVETRSCVCTANDFKPSSPAAELLETATELS
jgi:hypothetical protein